MAKTETKTERFNLRMRSSLKKRAEAAAAADHRSLGSLIDKLLDDYVREFERRSEKRK